MTTNLFVITNVKQLRTDGSFRILLHFFRTSWGVGVLNSAIFNSFHNRIEFGRILEGIRNIGVGVCLNPPPPSVRHCYPVEEDGFRSMKYGSVWNEERRWVMCNPNVC